MPELLVLNDVPDEITLSDAKRTSRIQIAKTGSFADPRYGKFSITSKDILKWIANFSVLNKSGGRLGLPVDVDHRPEKEGNTEAAGWLTHLTSSANGTELWATVEWNDLGIELVQNRRYAYISPSYVANYKDETGKEYGTALLGVALTNRPFLSMATVSLSRLHTTESYTPNEMAISKELATALGIAEDADDAVVLARVTELTKEPEPQKTTSLADQAKAEGMFVLTADQFASLTQNATEGAAAAASLKEQRFETAFTQALNDSKGARVTPAQKDQFKALYDGNADATITLLDALPNLVNAEPVGSRAPANTSTSLARDEVEDFDTDDYTNELAEKALALCTADKDLDYGDAVVLAAEQMGR